MGGQGVDVGRNATAAAGGLPEGVQSGISHPLIQQVGARQGCVACGSTSSTPLPRRGSKTTSGPGFEGLEMFRLQEKRVRVMTFDLRA